MQKPLILGAGIAGLTAATELEPLAAAEKLDITLVDSNPHFQMGFNMSNRSPEGLEGKRRFETERFAKWFAN